MSVACTYSASGTHRALVRGTSEGYLHIRQQSPLVSGMREPPAPGVPRTDASFHPPRAGPRAHGPRCACVPVAGGGRLACSARALPRYLLGRAAGDCCTRRCYHVTSCPATSSCYQLPCYQLLLPALLLPAALPKRYLELLGIACALHGPRIRAGRGAGRGSALTPQLHDICRRARRPCFSSPAASTLRRPCFSLSSFAMVSVCFITACLCITAVPITCLLFGDDPWKEHRNPLRSKLYIASDAT